jgi:hypothetical protein
MRTTSRMLNIHAFNVHARLFSDSPTLIDEGSQGASGGGGCAATQRDRLLGTQSIQQSGAGVPRASSAAAINLNSEARSEADALCTPRRILSCLRLASHPKSRCSAARLLQRPLNRDEGTARLIGTLAQSLKQKEWRWRHNCDYIGVRRAVHRR